MHLAVYQHPHVIAVEVLLKQILQIVARRDNWRKYFVDEKNIDQEDVVSSPTLWRSALTDTALLAASVHHYHETEELLNELWGKLYEGKWPLVVEVVQKNSSSVEDTVTRRYSCTGDPVVNPFEAVWCWKTVSLTNNTFLRFKLSQCIASNKTWTQERHFRIFQHV
jgi:hypothetical protein